MSLRFFIFIGLFSFVLLGTGACGDFKSGTTLNEVGTGDGGGGNVCNGKPIESYRFNVRNHPAFIKHIQPVLATVNGGQANGHVTSLFNYAFDKKPWYLMPCPFDILSSNTIGSLISTEQGALQTMDEIWLSQAALQGKDQTDSRAFADLIMHEAFMAMRLLQFESENKICEITAPDISYCGSQQVARSGNARDLTNNDYTIIRNATVEVFSFNMFTDANTWDDFFSRHFQVLGDYRRFAGFTDRRTITPQDLQSTIQATTITNSLPRVGLHHTGQGLAFEQTENCQLNININAGGLSTLTLTKGDGSQEYYEFLTTESQNSIAQTSERTGELEFFYAVKPIKQSINQGDVIEMVFLNFDTSMYRLTSVYVSRMYCLEPQMQNGQASCGSAQGPATPFNYTCSYR